jgi:flagellar motility protein MotE (MotC chaperone)
MKLPRFRLLPATTAAIMALLLVKSALFVQAVAGEAAPDARAGEAAPDVKAGGADPAAAAQAPAPLPAPLAQVTNVAPADSAAAVPPASKPAAQEQAPPVSDAERAVLLDLRQRREALEARAHELDQRAAEMAAADRRLNERVQQLAALQTRLESLEATREHHKEENWSGLVKVYETMKPREAAAIFDALDMQVLLQVLDRMQDRKAAPVLAAMQPDRARLATQLLAEMRLRAVSPPGQAAAATPTAPQTLPDPKG